MKALVMGLDGLGVDFFKRVGFSPHIDDYGELMTYSWSLPSWLCAISGKEFSPQMKVEDFVSHRNYGHLYLWDYLRDIRQVYLNIPVTYPAETVNGAFIAGDWRCNVMDSNSVKPHQLIGDLKKLGYRFNDDLGEHAAKGNWDGFAEDIKDHIRLRSDAMIFLAEKIVPEFMFTVYRMTDPALHQRVETRLGRKGIEDIYSFLEESITRVLEAVEADTVLFVSDHSINEQGYHGHTHESTFIGAWGIKTELDIVYPVEMAHIMDIAPTIFACLDKPCPPFKGHSLIAPDFEKKAFMDRMRRLGYIE